MLKSHWWIICHAQLFYYVDFFSVPTYSCLTRRLFCLCKYTIAECPVIYPSSILFVRGSPDAVLLLLPGWWICSLLDADSLV